MPTPAQIGAASAAIGGGALGGYLIANGLSGTKVPEKIKSQPELMNQVPSLQEYSLLTLTKETNLPHLLKPIQKKEAKEWWESAFTDKYKKLTQNKDPLFDGLTSAYSDTAVSGSGAKQTALNQACDAAYKKTKNDYSFESTSFLLQNISSFCTLDENGFDISEPKSVLHKTTKTDNGYTDGVLSKNENINKLVVKENTDNNDLWWKWAFKNLLTTEAKNSATQHFKNATSDYHDSTNTALNQVCDSAYKKPYKDLTDNSSKLLNDIKRFCTPNKAPIDSLTLPLWKEPTGAKHLKDQSSPTSYTSGVGKKDNNKERLIDPNKTENTDWWNWSFTTRFAILDNARKLALPEIFRSVNSGYNATVGTVGKQTSLNQACHESYSKSKAETDAGTGENQLKKVIKLFCSPSNAQDLEDPDVP